MSRSFLFFSAIAAVWGVILPANAGGPTPRASLQHSTDRLIVKLRDDAEALQPARLDELSKVAGVSLSVLRRTANGAYVLRTRAKMAHALAQVLAERLHFRPDVMYAEVDVLLEPQRTPNDSLFSSQWHYFEPAGGVGLPAAWDLTIGSNAITVAVIDSGLPPMPMLPGGPFQATTSSALRRLPMMATGVMQTRAIRAIGSPRQNRARGSSPAVE